MRKWLSKFCLVGLIALISVGVYRQLASRPVDRDPSALSEMDIMTPPQSALTSQRVEVVSAVVPAAAGEAASGDEAFKRFDKWVASYRAASNPGAQSVEEGVALARERREAFRKLIRSNPKEAIARAFSTETLAEMPEGISMYMERHVRGTASSSMFSPGGLEHYTENYRELMVRGEALHAYVYGNRSEQLLFRNDDIHGVAVGPDMAVEDAAQIQEDILASQDLPGKVTEGCVSVTLELSKDDLVFTRSGKYDTVSLKDGFMREDKPGTPWLPTRSVQVLLPAGALVQSVQATAGESVLRTGINLLPVQPPVPMMKGVKADFVEPNTEAYASPGKFPASLVDGNTAGRRKGWTTVSVLVNPARYVPAKQTLYFAERMEISVRYELPPVPPVVFVGQKGSEEKESAHRVVNPDQAGASPYYVGRGGWSAKDWLSGTEVAPPLARDGEPEPLAGESISFSSPTYTVNEAGKNLTVSVNIGKAPTNTVTVDYATSNGTAQAGSDYTSTSGTLTWLANDSRSKSFNVPIQDDLLPEGAETFSVRLSNVTGGAILESTSATVTINDDDTPGEFRFSQSSYEVMENSTAVTVTVVRAVGAIGAVSVNYATSNGTATAGQDYTAFSGTLNFATGETSKDVSFTILNDTSYEGAVESFVVVLSNPTGGAVLGSPTTTAINISEDDPMPGAVDYVIITSASLAGSCAALQAHRQAFNGFQVEIKDTTWIGANYSGTKPNGASDTQTKIQNFIKDYVATKGLQYVCIIGDDTVVADRNCYVTCSTSTASDMPTDLYWAGLDSSWDEDADGTYGEANYSGVSDEGDLNYDVIVGRIPVRTTAQLTDYVNKLINYETNPLEDVARKFMLAGDISWYTYTSTNRPTDSMNDGHAQFRDAYHTTVSDSEMWIRRLYRDNAQGYGWQAKTIGCLFDTLTSWDTTTCGNYAADQGHMVTRFSEGWNFVLHSSHGSTTALMSEGTDWSAGGIASLSGLAAYFHTSACDSGGFDKADPSFSEATLRNPNGGSIVYLGCSRFGWGYSDAPPAGLGVNGTSDLYQRSWLQAIFRDKNIISGKAFHEMKLDHAGYSGSNGADRWIQFGLNHQGDPAAYIQGVKPSVSVNVIEPLAAEPGTDTASICFERTGSVSNSLAIFYTRSGTATAPGDFETSPTTASSGSVIIPAGTNRLVLTLTPANDTNAESDESVMFTILADTTYFIKGGTETAAMTILDDDNAVTPTVEVLLLDGSAAEQNSDPGKLRITRSGSASAALSVNYTLSGSAHASDYSETLSGVATLGAGVASIDITITPVNDILVEGDETLGLTLTNGSGYTLGSTVSAVISIAENEARPSVTLSATDNTATENTADTAVLRFTRSGDTSLPLSVSYTTAGSASASDYTPALNGTVTLPVGSNSVDIVITTLNDSSHELIETLVVTVVPGAAYYSVGTPSQATITINDDDNGVPLVSAGLDRTVWVTTVPMPTFVQDSGAQGLVSIEAEHYHEKEDATNKAWTNITDASASGGVAMDSAPDDGVAADGMVKMTYRVNFVKTGTHYFWIRGRAWARTGTAGNADSVFGGLDGVASDAIASFSTSYGWSRTINGGTAAVSINVATPGVHTIELSMREDGFVADKILLTTDSVYTPTGTGPVESTVGEAMLSGATATLAGTVSDPDNDALTTLWTVQSGPSQVLFVDATVTNTVVQFYAPGTYTLRLTADDTLAQAFNDVTITVLSASTILNLAQTDLSDTSATFNCSLNASGTNCAVTVYYGTSDGGTNAGAWTRSVTVGSWTNVSTNVSYTASDLVPSQAYYYTFSASNATMTSWATPSWSFTTLDDMRLPVINAGVATNITDTSALLSGDLVSTGTAPTTVWCYWNPNSDPQSDVSGWQYSRSFGVASDPQLYTNDTAETAALTPNTRYYYRFAAVNSYGTNWSDTGSFDTFGPPQVENTGGGESVSETAAVLHGELSTCTDAEVWICWGVMDRGTKSVLDWDGRTSLGSIAEGVAFSNLVTGLSTNTTYFYRCYAENPYGSDWSDAATTFSGTPVGGGILATSSGGTVTNYTRNGTNYTAHIFTNSGTFNVVMGGNIEVLVVGGGGGGGLNGGGGGGAGGLLAVTTNITTATNISITVGAGGNGSTSSVYPGRNGNNSIFGSIQALGGGGGGGAPNTGRSAGVAGGSGGGGGTGRAGGSGTAGQGNNGGAGGAEATAGWPGGGGGGAGSVGLSGFNSATASLCKGGNGGTGVVSSISGAANWYAGGGGGHSWAGTQGSGGFGGGGNGQTGTGVAGINNTGGGGGSGSTGGGNGGSGIVIVRYVRGGMIDNLAPTAISESAATFNASLAASGTNYNVTVYYGTSDGGTNAASWAASAEVGSWTNVASTNISYTASELTFGQMYYYTFMASNTTGRAWASSSWTFGTLGTVQSATASHAVPYAWLATAVPASTNDYEAAALADQDGDGFTTWQEYWSGTDPVNSNSFLRIDSVTLEGGNAVLKWQHAAVDTGLPALTIQTTTNLQFGTWVYTGQKSPVNGTNTWSGAALPQQLFYRLAVTNAP